ncbi:tyrosine-type recombinase/integrase [Streptomyces sp. NPDC056708]|uniref:tyrosine-type recombinase/integrase n=1 Tax=unclassified Streptomyces TaxID=2593676 RepID=UPI0036A038CD
MVYDRPSWECPFDPADGFRYTADRTPACVHPHKVGLEPDRIAPPPKTETAIDEPEVTPRRRRGWRPSFPAQRRLDEISSTIRQQAEMPEELELHSLRHSYITHLIEFGYPERFVQDQVGHRYGSTTALYTWVSDEFRNRLLEQSLQRQSVRPSDRRRKPENRRK